VGGAPEIHDPLLANVAARWPTLRIGGAWTPARAVLDDPAASARLAAEVARTAPDVLVVGFGKARQERWIEQYGAATGATVLLAFGAVVDFLAGRVTRAPVWWSDHGLEWLFRLGKEPRRLARRYLVYGPPALMRALTESYVVERREADLSRPSGVGTPTSRASRQVGAVVIPAHNEGAVIRRTLAPFTEALAEKRVEVVVVPNGCNDDTATLAASVPGVKVRSIDQGSKPGALNVGDETATAWPRLYLDADVEVTWPTVENLFVRLAESGALAGRPRFRYDTTGSSWLVRAYYRARWRIPEMHAHLWGAGAYAMTELGHRRLGAFPPMKADDFWVDTRFDANEVVITQGVPVVVRTPRTTRVLLRTLRRVYGGTDEAGGTELRHDRAGGTGLGVVLRTVRSLRSGVDAAVYVGVVGIARFRQPTAGAAWQRDETSRQRSRS
jgi:exopolysaccharide biosynthesis WecB/TagA/CpsF family protein